jgi:hypothetical protein
MKGLEKKSDLVVKEESRADGASREGVAMNQRKRKGLFPGLL